MKSSVVFSLLLCSVFIACQPTYPAIFDAELRIFLLENLVEKIVIEDQQIAYIDLKEGRAPYDYKMTIASTKAFIDQVVTIQEQSGSDMSEWVIPISEKQPKEEGVYAVFENRSNDSHRSMMPYFAILMGILVYLVPALIVIWIIRLLRRIDRNLQEINKKLH
ncbi:MAG: hypothetical protein ACK4TA_04990 [Saprospiraceae bacterium]